MIKEFCDICGKEIESFEMSSESLLKKKVYSWHKTYCGRLTVHTDCWEDLREILGKRNNNQGEE